MALFNMKIDTKAKILMIISSLSFSIMVSFVKISSHTVAIKVLSRQMISLIFMFFFIIVYDIRVIPLKGNRIKLLLRCLFGSLGIYLYFYSIDNLLLADASMLTRLSPFFVTLFAFLILKESVNYINWLIFIPIIIGCILIIKPNTTLFNPASIFAILSAISGALAYTMIRSIGDDESTYTIIFWFSLVSSIIYFLIFGKGLMEVNSIEYFNLTMIGILGVIGQIGLTFAYQLSKASEIAPYSYFYILFSGFIGYQVWNEIPDFLSIVGYCLIIISYYFIIRLNRV